MIDIPAVYRFALRKYKFIDLFCGIGGFNLALSSLGAKCVFASDIDEKAKKIYKRNFQLLPHGDITKIDESSIPPHDILCGGFPCQPFSISGNRLGFNDVDRGQMFFEIIRIAKFHCPKIIFLENVQALKSHNNGATIKSIKSELNQLGYNTFTEVLNSADFGIPQVRKRLYIVAFRNDLGVLKFDFPAKRELNCCLQDFLENSNNTKAFEISRDYELNRSKLNSSINRKRCIRIGSIGLGRQGERIYSIEGSSTTLSSTGGGLGGKTGIYYINDKIRKLTPRECLRLMGFPEYFEMEETTNQAYKHLGNSVVIDVLQYICMNIFDAIAIGRAK